MWNSRSIAMSIVLLVFFYFILPQKAHAYLDPGTGSYVLQILVAALAGGLFVVKMFWKNIKSFFQGVLSGKGEHGQDGPDRDAYEHDKHDQE